MLPITSEYTLQAVSKPKEDSNHLVLQVSVDSFRATDYLNSGSDLFIIFGEYASVGIGIVATDNNDSFDTQLFNNFETTVELILRFPVWYVPNR